MIVNKNNYHEGTESNSDPSLTLARSLSVGDHSFDNITTRRYGVTKIFLIILLFIIRHTVSSVIVI